MGCRARGAKPKRRRRMATDPFAPVRRLVRRGARERAQRPRSDGARDRRRGGPAVGADGPAQGPRARRLRLLHQRAERARASSSPPTRAPRCCSTGSRCAARSGSKARSSASPDAEADAYFATRARDSQLGAWASDQSRPLDSRETFEAALRGDEAAVRRPGRAAPAALGRLSRDPGADRILDRPAAPPPRAAPVHARRRRLERRAALPMTDRQDRRPSIRR